MRVREQDDEQGFYIIKPWQIQFLFGHKTRSEEEYEKRKVKQTATKTKNLIPKLAIVVLGVDYVIVNTWKRQCSLKINAQRDCY